LLVDGLYNNGLSTEKFVLEQVM